MESAEEVAHEKVPSPLRLLLIRHAQSINNVDKAVVKHSWAELRTGVWPTSLPWRSFGALLTVPMDTDLSPDGLVMVTTQRQVLSSANFLAEQKVDVILHSHLLRAQRTAEGLFSGNERNLTLQCHQGLYEKDVLETFGVSSIAERVEAFKRSLLFPEEKGGILPGGTQTVVVVGHSAFFRQLMGRTEGMKNCEVQECWLFADGRCVPSEEPMFPGGEVLCP
jgi:broad specificity phosphatase PhoE